MSAENTASHWLRVLANAMEDLEAARSREVRALEELTKLAPHLFPTLAQAPISVAVADVMAQSVAEPSKPAKQRPSEEQERVRAENAVKARWPVPPPGRVRKQDYARLRGVQSNALSHHLDLINTLLDKDGFLSIEEADRVLVGKTSPTSKLGVAVRLATSLPESATPRPEPDSAPAPEVEPTPEPAVETPPEPAIEIPSEPQPEPPAEPTPEPAPEPTPEPAAAVSALDELLGAPKVEPKPSFAVVNAPTVITTEGGPSIGRVARRAAEFLRVRDGWQVRPADAEKLEGVWIMGGKHVSAWELIIEARRKGAKLPALSDQAA